MRNECNKIFFVYLLLQLFMSSIAAQPSAVIKQIMDCKEMSHALIGCMVEEVGKKEAVVSHNADTRLVPASVLKSITTATALEILGKNYRYPTEIQYDGIITDGVLKGNIYIKGHGDPTLGSRHFEPQSKEFIQEWVTAVISAGIKKIEGGIVSDESLFDTEGISAKWLLEDLGSYYGAGSYALNIFDNTFSLYLNSGDTGTRPHIVRTDPVMGITFHNYLKVSPENRDSCYIIGMPFCQERYLYGAIPANKTGYWLKGDIPDPALFIADYFEKALADKGINTSIPASCSRLLQETGKWERRERKELTTTYSPTLSEIIEKTNHVSHNLFADALLKTIGLRYQPQKNESISSFGRGIMVMKNFWKEHGIDISVMNIYDGSGLAATDKVTAKSICSILNYMASKSKHSDAFINSLPAAGQEGSVSNFLKGTNLEGKAWLKSGSMSGVRCYAGYVRHNGKLYCVALLANGFDGNSRTINRILSDLLLGLFGE